MSTVSTTIQLDSTLQQESQTLFESLGLSLNAAITIFLRQSVREQAIPFRVGQPVFNEETRRAIEDTRRDIGVSKAYHSTGILYAPLDAEEQTSETSLRGVLSEYAKKEGEQPEAKSLRGVLSEYANPDLMGREEGAWERAVAEKYGDFRHEHDFTLSVK